MRVSSSSLRASTYISDTMHDELTRSELGKAVCMCVCVDTWAAATAATTTTRRRDGTVDIKTANHSASSIPHGFSFLFFYLFIFFIYLPRSCLFFRFGAARPLTKHLGDLWQKPFPTWTIFFFWFFFLLIFVVLSLRTSSATINSPNGNGSLWSAARFVF